MTIWALQVYLALWAHLESDLRGCLVAYALKQPEADA